MRFPGQSGGGYGHGLVTVKVACSCVLAADIGTVWRTVRDFSSCWAQGADLYGGQRVACLDLLGGAHGTTVGALRTLNFASLQSQGQFLEKLVALDDIEHYTRWQTVSHNANVNPFPGAYLNADSCLRLKPVTASCQSLLELEATFLTEAGQAEAMQVSIDQHLNAPMTMLQQSISQLPRPAPTNPPSRAPTGTMPVASHPLTSMGLAPPSVFHQCPTQQMPVTLQDLASSSIHRRSSFGQDTFFPQPSWSSIDTSSCQGHMQPDWLSSAGHKPTMPSLPPGPLLSGALSQSGSSASAFQTHAQDPRRQATAVRSQQKPPKDVKLGWQSGNSAGSSGGRGTPDGPAILSPKASQSPRVSHSPSAILSGDTAAPVLHHAAPCLNSAADASNPHSRMVSPQMSGSPGASAPSSPAGAGSLAAPARHSLSTSPLQQKLTDTLQRKHSGSLQRLHPELQKGAPSPGSRHRGPQHSMPGLASAQASPFAAAAFPADESDQASVDQRAPREQLSDGMHQRSPFAAAPAQQAMHSHPAHAVQTDVQEGVAAAHSDGPAFTSPFAAAPAQQAMHSHPARAMQTHVQAATAGHQNNSNGPVFASPFASATAQHQDSHLQTRSAPVQPQVQQSAPAGSHGGRATSPFATHASQHRPASSPVQLETDQLRPGGPADVPPDRV